MAGLAGKWHLEQTENFDEYMQALGEFQMRCLLKQSRVFQHTTNEPVCANLHNLPCTVSCERRLFVL